MERTSLQLLHDQWKNFDLSGQRKHWDVSAEEMVAKRREYMISRKKLAAGTKKFRTLSQEDQIRVFGSLLKSYQEEVDRLTQRSSEGEKLFLRVYKELSEIPDPVVGLHKSLDTLELQENLSKEVLELKAERNSLVEELDSIKAESVHIRDQGVTIRDLEQQLKEYQEDSSNLIQSQVEEKEALLRQEYDALLDELRERKAEVEKQHGAACDELVDMRTQLEVLQSKLIARDRKDDIDHAAKQSQMEMLLNEVERSRETIMMLERELELAKGSSDKTSDASAPDMAVIVAQKDVQIRQLLEQVSSLEERLEDSESFRDAELHEALEDERARVASLESQLRDAAPKDVVDDLRNQLDILKSAHGIKGQVEVNEDVVRKSLQSKNKRLETECMQLKVSVAQAIEQSESMKRERDTLAEELASTKLLISKLEEDLSHKTVRDGSPESAPVASQSGEDLSMVEIVCKQRDRFKARTQQLEEENQKAMDLCREKDRELERLQNDNVKLYTKVRFLQSYQPRGSPSPASRDPEWGHSDTRASFKEYGRLYEAKVDPFLHFKGKERQDRIKSLNAAERMTLQTSRFVLANKYSRMFIFFYSLALHLLVFTTLFLWSSSSQPVYMEEG